MEMQEQLLQLMTEIGPVLDLEEVSYLPDQGLWILGKDEDAVLEAELHADSGLLLLAAEVGQVPEARRTAFYEMLLRYNFLWRDTGGLVLSLDGAAGNVILQYSCPADGLDLQQLQGLLESLFRQIDLWREAVAGWTEGVDGAEEGGDELSASDISVLQGAIRA